MKIAILSESPADEAALRILIDGLLGRKTELVPLLAPKTRGWHGVLKAKSVRQTLQHLRYTTDADAVVFSLDSDDTPVHQRGHDQPGGECRKCRLCQLRASVAKAQSKLRPRQGRGPIKTALGLAVPAIEAWYLAGSDPHITESAWIQALQSGKLPYTKNELKRRVYGTERPSLALEEKCAVEHAGRLVQQEKLDRLQRLFPSGFGALANGVRGW